MHEEYANIRDGRQVVTTGGTRVQFSATNVRMGRIRITALSTNTNPVVVGSSTVVAAAGTRRGAPLAAGETVDMYIQDLSDLWLDAVTSGEGVSYAYFF